jgi:hypothetical protein
MITTCTVLPSELTTPTFGLTTLTVRLIKPTFWADQTDSRVDQADFLG